MTVKIERFFLLTFLLGTSPAWTWAGGTQKVDTARAQSDVMYNTGLTYLRSNRPDLAIDQFKKTVDLDSKNYFAYKGLGIAYAQTKNFKEAEKAQRKCLEINPDFADARNDLAATLMYLGRREEARKEWLTAYASPFNPSPDQTAWNLGNSYVEENNAAEAVRWYQSSLEHNAGYAPAHVALASALVSENKLDEAVTDLEGAVKATPGNVDLTFALGDAYFRAGRFPESRAQFETVVKKDTNGTAGKRAAEMLKHFPK
jgi:Flp pilus assembly protein TadD